jgi:hypothetical protein
VFNESQPVCPACGVPPSSSDPDDFDRMEFEALEGLNEFDEDLEIETEAEETEPERPTTGFTQWVN